MQAVQKVELQKELNEVVDATGLKQLYKKYFMSDKEKDPKEYFKKINDFFRTVVKYNGQNKYINKMKNDVFIEECAEYNRGILPLIKDLDAFKEYFKEVLPPDVIQEIETEYNELNKLRRKIQKSNSEEEFMANARDFIERFRDSNFLPLYHDGRDKVALWTNWGMGVDGDAIRLIRTPEYKDYVNDSLSMLFSELWRIVPDYLKEAGEDIAKQKQAERDEKTLTEQDFNSTQFFRDLHEECMKVAREWNINATKPSHVPYDKLLSQLFIEAAPDEKLQDVRIEWGQNLPEETKLSVEKATGIPYTLQINTCNVFAQAELPIFLSRVAAYNVNKRKLGQFNKIITLHEAVSKGQKSEEAKEDDFLPLTYGGTPQRPGTVVNVSLQKLLSLIEEVTILKREKLEMEETRAIILKVVEEHHRANELEHVEYKNLSGPLTSKKKIDFIKTKGSEYGISIADEPAFTEEEKKAEKFYNIFSSELNIVKSKSFTFGTLLDQKRKLTTLIEEIERLDNTAENYETKVDNLIRSKFFCANNFCKKLNDITALAQKEEKTKLAILQEELNELEKRKGENSIQTRKEQLESKMKEFERGHEQYQEREKEHEKEVNNKVEEIKKKMKEEAIAIRNNITDKTTATKYFQTCVKKSREVGSSTSGIGAGQ